MTRFTHRCSTHFAIQAALLWATIHAQADTFWLYEDALSNNWQDWSYNSTRDFSNNDPVYSGNSSAAITITGDWGALSLNHFPITAADYETLTFAIRAAQDNPDLQIICHNGDTRFTDLILTNYTTGPVTTDAWQVVTIPLADFVITNTTLTRFDWQGRQASARPDFYLDQVGLLPSSLLAIDFAHISSPDAVTLFFRETLNPESLISADYLLSNPDDPNYAVAVNGSYSSYETNDYSVVITFPHNLTTNGVYQLVVNGITNAAGDAATQSATTQLRLAQSTVTVACFSNEHRISPYIYGVNLAPDLDYLRGAGFTVNRRSGNDNSCYNWKLETSNRAEDGWYQNFHWDPVHPTNSLELTALMNAQAGAATFWTMPMQEWVAKDDSSYSFSVAKYGPQEFSNGDMGNGYFTNGIDRITNNPTDAYVPAKAFTEPGDPADTVYMDEWLEHLNARFGPLTQPLLPFVSLDNEIDIWYDVHHDTWHTEMTYDVIRDKFITYASMVHSNMPGMKVFGPVSTSWWFYWNSDAGAADKAAHDDTDFIVWFLQQMKDYEDTHGQRLLDVLDIHYYPAKPLIFNNNIDTNTRAIRIAEIDSFWNTNYIDAWDGISNNPWATSQPDSDKPYIIPRFQALIASNYPGTRLAISEWQMGADYDISAGIAVADGLGVFGREDLYMACYWRWGSDVPTNSAAYNAFKLYGNYDSQGSRFAPLSVPVSAVGSDLLSVYAARSEDGTRLTLVGVNRSPDTDTRVDLTLSNFAARTNIATAQLNERYTESLKTGTRTDGSSSMTLILPAYSATLFEFTAPSIDDDSDGMPTPWEMLYTNATDSGATPLDPYTDDSAADNDGDSASNLDEYKALTDPTASNSVFRITYTPTTFSEMFSCDGAAGRTFECLTSDSLATAASNWTGLGTLPGTGLMLLWSNGAPPTSAYFRLKAR
jgi:phosphatidylinositol glycan class B